MLDRPESDVVTEMLALMHLRATVYANPRVCGHWRLDSVEHGTAVFHFVARGTAWLHLSDGTPPQALRAGDMVVFPRDLEHSLAGDAQLPQVAAAQSGAGPVTELICGQFDLAQPASAMLLDALPPVLVIDGETAIPGLSGLGRLLASEAGTCALGRQIVLDRLAEVLFVAILRYAVADLRIARGVLAGLRDPGIARALSAMTSRPGAAWSIASLAAHAGMSRTAFVQRFTALVGQPPIAWLTRLRMERGAALLADAELSVGKVAAQLGYRTEAAFRRAFKRARGIGPGAIRRRLRSARAVDAA